MKNEAVVKRYTDSLFAVCSEMDCADKVLEDLRLIRDAYSISELARFLDAPATLIPDTQKKEIVKELFDGRIHELCLNFLYVLIEKKRTFILADCADLFENKLHEQNKEVMPQIESAYELSDEEIDSLSAALAKHIDKKVIIRRESVKVNPLLIGGIKITIGNNVVDGSLAASLADLKHDLMKDFLRYGEKKRR